jgi:pimeloyl-ACP methyl ester carboxylesterase
VPPHVTTFALVHGAWHDGACWDPVRPLLEARGHATLAPDLPASDPAATFPDYAAVVVDALRDAGDDVIVVGHSLGSDTIPLVAAARPVRALVYLCPNMGRSFARPRGGPRAFRAELPMPVPAADGASTWDPAVAAEHLYAHLEPAAAAAAAARLRTQYFPPDADPPLTLPAVPAHFLYTPEDEIFEPARQVWIAEQALGVAPEAFPGGHFPMLERPLELTERLDRVATAG